MTLRLRWKRFQRLLHSFLPYQVKKKYGPDQVTDLLCLIGTWVAAMTIFYVGIKVMFSGVKTPTSVVIQHTVGHI